MLTKSHFKILLWMPIAIPLLLAMRLVRPWLRVRLLNLNAHVMGGLVRDPDIYARMQKLKTPLFIRTLDFIYCGPKQANTHLALMWKRYFGNVWDGWVYWLFFTLECLNRKLPGGEYHGYPLQSEIPSKSVLKTVEPYLTFTLEEQKKGDLILEKMGIPNGAKIIGLLVRDSAYMNSYAPEINDRINDFRNCEISNFVPMCSAVAARGYYVVRMGAKVLKPLVCKETQVIDYASSSYRSDFMDMYLASKVCLFMTTVTGFDRVPTYLFNKPIVAFNYVGVSHIWDEWRWMEVFISKKYYLSSERRYLSLREIFLRGLDSVFNNFGFEFGENSLLCEENTPEELKYVALEAIDRLESKWISMPEDEELQKRYWSFFS